MNEDTSAVILVKNDDKIDVKVRATSGELVEMFVEMLSYDKRIFLAVMDAISAWGVANKTLADENIESILSKTNNDILLNSILKNKKGHDD